jgi:hypothetical protein
MDLSDVLAWLKTASNQEKQQVVEAISSLEEDRCLSEDLPSPTIVMPEEWFKEFIYNDD